MSVSNLRWFRWLCIFLAVSFVVLPLLFWQAKRAAYSIPASEVPSRLRAGGSGAILVDIRGREDFERMRVPGSINIPYSELSSVPASSWKEKLAGKTTLLVVCNVGISSARAAGLLREAGFTGAVSVEGGWDALLYQIQPGICLYGNGSLPPENTEELVKTHGQSLFAQIAITAAAFGLKPLYELLALLLAIILWRCRETDLAALKWSMTAFFIGENACTVNFLLFNDQSRLWEYFHSCGMLAAFGFFIFAVMEALDRRVIHFSRREDRCGMLAVCGKCYKQQEVRCRLWRIFLFVPPAAGAAAAMLLTASPRLQVIRSNVLGTDVLFGHPLVSQLFEIRFCPLAALPFLLAAWIILLRKRETGFEAAKVLTATGMGFLAFGFMRFLLYHGYSANPLWADFWEEATEFLFIAFLVWLAGMDFVRGWRNRIFSGKSLPPDAAPC